MNTRLLSTIALAITMLAFGTAQAAEAVADKASAATGTKAERKAARAAKRAETKEALKKGEIPRTNEAGDVKK